MRSSWRVCSSARTASYRLSGGQIDSAHKRLDKDKSAAVWMYMPGYLDEKGGFDIERVRRVTGFGVRNVPGRTAAVGMHELEGCRWNERIFDLDLSPRPVFARGQWRTLARYVSDSLPAVAVQEHNGRLQFFFGCPGPGVRAEVFRRLFQMAGVHLWTPEQEAIVQSNGRNLTVYTGKPGLLTIRLPLGIEATALDAMAVKRAGRTLSAHLEERGIAWLRLEHK